MAEDEVITEVRKAREQISARFDNDLEKIVAFFQREEKKSRAKLYNYQDKKKKNSPSSGENTAGKGDNP
ncbi:MAG: hypothetical protein LAT75_01145 [Candidatus Cyclonatronum sp.]|uniref:hypothetical protein n=1 Tax=Cyclonatronum sp. TaxID=3024185 RepID=UPI0025BB66D0|nr:hypothetical protein [Cyclonatronum sp.]MCC5935582.1 hypothetical protein [Balneolales bacterium]MCH8485438.1 hypothetical protein [Cyclonatronum sp.]